MGANAVAERDEAAMIPNGRVEPGYEPVAMAFAGCVADAPGGAAFAAMVDGELVVDLWGGSARHDPEADWCADTPAVLLSGTKGLVAIVFLILADRGELSMNDRVDRFWPEFGTNGKHELTVADILSHTAGLPNIDPKPTEAELLDSRAMAERLAHQVPLWPETRKVAYHALTYGWLADEIVRRITGRSVAQVLASEVVEPLRLDIWIGAPREVADRAAALRTTSESRTSWESLWRRPLIPEVYVTRRLLADPLIWNERWFQMGEFPAGNAIATARSMATLYGLLVCGGGPTALRICREATLADALGQRAFGRDPLSGELLSYGVGFQRTTSVSRLGPAPDAFGHDGAGGSVHGGWPKRRTGFSFVTNVLQNDACDERARVLLASLHGLVAER